MEIWLTFRNAVKRIVTKDSNWPTRVTSGRC
jgi:hypothetical protein